MNDIATRSFDMAQQRAFAALSGDWNPMHMDPLAARRTQAGRPVVHGVHAALWALDELIAAGKPAAPIDALEVRFQKFIHLDTEVTLRVTRETPDALHAELRSGELTTTTLALRFAPSSSPQKAAPLCTRTLPAPQTPCTPAFADLTQSAGLLPNTGNERVAQFFPRAARCLGSARIEAMARLSTVVGMHCPGLHSIFGAFSLRFTSQPDEIHGLSFQVRTIDERFRMLEIDVAGSGFLGTITAFARQEPMSTPGVSALVPLVGAGAFSATTALIVGGSRGLGALTAKAIAAGGGRVVITYLVGEEEALEIEEEIGADTCRVLRYDARKEAAPQLADLAWNIDQLYYFATTQIFRQKAAWYEPKLFAEFCSVYVDGFQALCSSLRARLALAGNAPKLSAFYPSSVAVENRPKDITEYSMAKAAGELLCADMNRFLPGMRILVKRLPRMLTDQTATVVPAESSDPLEVMLPIIMEMHEHAPSQLTRPAVG